jgi:hypothetical protein
MKQTALLVVFNLLLCLGLADPGHSSSTYQSIWLQLTQCNLYYNIDAQGNPQFKGCATVTFTNLDWTICFQACCGTSQYSTYSTFSRSALDYC